MLARVTEDVAINRRPWLRIGRVALRLRGREPRLPYFQQRLQRWLWRQPGCACRSEKCRAPARRTSAALRRSLLEPWPGSRGSTASSGPRSRRWARAGTTTTMPFPRRRCTASIRGSSTSAFSLSGCWNARDSPQTFKRPLTCRRARAFRASINDRNDTPWDDVPDGDVDGTLGCSNAPRAREDSSCEDS